MRDPIEGFSEIEEYNINLAGFIKNGGKSFNGGEKLSSGREPLAKAMLARGQNTTFIKKFICHVI